MGSTTFHTRVQVPKTTSDADAFRIARDGAKHEHGHGGYTGTLAEKSSFDMIARVKSARNAEVIADALLHEDTNGISCYRQEARDCVDDKWGPAGALRYPIDAATDGVLFFGYASC